MSPEEEEARTALVALRRAWDEEWRAEATVREALNALRDQRELDLSMRAAGFPSSLERLTAIARIGVALGLAQARHASTVEAVKVVEDRVDAAMAKVRLRGGR